ncbi:MAG: helicase [Chromatiaceae bacterium]|nr:helicase [Chromatiaceae bacterium]
MPERPSPNLRTYPWEQCYATSDLRPDGQPVDILHNFYIPALSRATRYDRVAGYFTSTSLAAASQGFSRFVEQGGKARFIVGLQLTPEDAEAILQGHQQRAAEPMLAALEGAPEWPSSVRQGVELLGWMIAHGCLQVRVGLRVHGQPGPDQGTPQPLDYAQDGYLHEKWAIFSDGQDALFISGSLNESQTALAVNAENITVQPSWSDWNLKLIANKRASFEALWQGKHAFIRTLSLPEAVGERLIQIAEHAVSLREIDGTPMRPPEKKRGDAQDNPNEVVAPSFSEQLRFAMIRLAPLLPGGERVALETTPIEPWPHQRFVARRLLETYPRNHLLCDEVGLGKTIEAGLAFRALWLSGRAKSIRVFAPASLTSQWLNEMAEKFMLPFVRRTSRSGDWERIELRTGEPINGKGNPFDAPLEIISTGLIINRKGDRLLAQLPETDLVLVDEAHKARRQSPDNSAQMPRYNKLYQELSSALYGRSRALLLATATPMQLNRVEAFDLLKLMPSAGAVQFCEDLCELFYRVRERLLQGDALAEYEAQWLGRYLREARKSSPEQWRFVEEHVLSLFGKSGLQDFVDNDQPPLGGWHELQPSLSLLAPLGRSMLRHSRSLLRAYQREGLLNANLAWREVHPCIIPLQGLELEVYEQLQQYCAELADRIAANMEEGKQRAAIGFYLCFLRLRFASSFHALRCSLERRLIKLEQTLTHKAQQLNLDEEDREALEELDEAEVEGLVLKNRSESDLTWEQTAVEALLQQMRQLPKVPRKTHQLLEHIEQRRIPGADRVRQLVIFTRYADNLAALHRELCSRLPRCPIGTFSGLGGSLRRAGEHKPEGMDRTAIKQRFVAGQIDILLCTDAAAEGLNLQSADLLINFDLPWNPMMLEQRIGRIDRIGQHHEQIQVYNYLYQNSVEEVVYSRLVKRFREAISVSGELQFSLLPIQPEDFEDFAKSKDEPGQIDEEELIRRAKAHVVQISERQRLTEFPAQAQKQAYEQLDAEAMTQPLPASLDSIWQVLSESAQPRGYLHALGARIESFRQGEALALDRVLQFPAPALLTCSRALFEEGLGPEDRRRLHFATYGDPLFEQLLDHVLQPNKAPFDGIPSCWTDRQPLTALELGGKRLVSVDDALAAGRMEAQPVTLLPRSVPSLQTQSDHLGRQQRILLETAAAHYAKKKLKEDPDTVKQQIAEFERFQADVMKRPTPAVHFNCEVPDRNAMLALKNKLLWPISNNNPSIMVDGDPLLLDAVRALLLRQLGEMKKHNRTGPDVAKALRERARSS